MPHYEAWSLYKNMYLFLNRLHVMDTYSKGKKNSNKFTETCRECFQSCPRTFPLWTQHKIPNMETTFLMFFYVLYK